MDEKLRQELAAWLEFFRELGIEGLYQREVSGAETKRSTAQGESTGPVMPAEGAGKPFPGQVPFTVPAGKVTGAPQSGKAGRAAKPPATLAPPVTPVTRPSTVRPPVPTLSLFEVPHPQRGGPETLEQIREDLGDCQRCKLAGGRKTIVFGEGNPRAELVFIGEGPGADEDQQGRPFVGRAGQLLNRMILTIGMKREDVYICNVVKCRPPGNRTPEKDEVEACSPFLFRQIEAIRPRLICCLGAPAVRTVLGSKEGITKIRGRFFDFAGTKALATVHPAYILRNPREEKILREDFEKIREFLATK